MTTKRIAIDKIDPDPGQPRKEFDETALNELAASIEARGLIQAIVVRPSKRGRYIIVAGERRWRAHKLLIARKKSRFASIHARIVKNIKTVDVRINQIIENVQRADMKPLEEAAALAELVNEHGMEPEDIAAQLGLAPFRVRWRLQLLNLDPQVRKLVATEQLDRQQALELARLPDHKDQRRTVQLINSGALSGWKNLRNAVDAVIGGTTTEDLFGEEAPRASTEDVETVTAMEAKIDRVASMVAGGWHNGECVVATKVSPDRAIKMADTLGVARQAIAIMERELRNAAGQAKIVMRVA